MLPLPGLLSPSTRVAFEPPNAPLVGTWVSTDSDGSSQTLEIVGSGGDDYEFVLRDDFATACSGAPATMTGAGLLETEERLIIAQPELTCDDGTSPRIGTPPQAELANFTLELDTATDELVDSLGVVWRRSGSNDESVTWGGMWPQSTLDEIRAAQERADAGDPAYTWQLDATLAAEGEPWGAEIFARFIEVELGWEEFSGASFAGYMSGDGGGQYESVLFIRCAPGQRNPLEPLYADVPPQIRRCAPTINEHTYETVRLSVTQPGRRDASGIWVVSRWEILQSKRDPSALYEVLSPDYLVADPGRIEQVTPPSDAEGTAILQAFLRARVDGEGAEQYLLTEPEESPFEDTQVPLLYATTGGARYERYEIQRVKGPVWPTGWMEYKVRLFTDGETVVEQHFQVVRDENEQLGLLYGFGEPEVTTTENGQSVAVPFSEFGDTVTFTAPPPRVVLDDSSFEFGSAASSDGRVVFTVDPRPDSQAPECETVGGVSRLDALGVGDLIPPADASALLRSIEADPGYEITGTGSGSLPIDFDLVELNVTFSADADPCYGVWVPRNASVDGARWRMRLHLINYPRESALPSESSWRPQVLAIAVIAPETDFERVLREATPILESLQFHPR
jgi:hypothetical protein